MAKTIEFNPKCRPPAQPQHDLSGFQVLREKRDVETLIKVSSPLQDEWNSPDAPLSLGSASGETGTGSGSEEGAARALNPLSAADRAGADHAPRIGDEANLRSLDFARIAGRASGRETEPV